MKYNTYRSVLYRLNILCGCVAVVQLISSTWCFVILQNRSIVNRTVTMESDTEIEYDSRFQVLTNVWNLNGSIWGLGILALIVLVAVTCTVRAIQNVDLVGAIRFFWIILWVVPLQVRNARDDERNSGRVSFSHSIFLVLLLFDGSYSGP